MLLAPAPPNPYADAALRVNLLGADLLKTRERRGITAAAQAEEIGIGIPTLAGLIAGTTNPVRSTVVAALRWLAQPEQEHR